MSETSRPTNREIATALGEAIGIDIFSLEYEILAFLHEAGGASHKEILFSLGCSAATLQRKLNHLAARELIRSDIDEDDRRRRVFILTGATKCILDEELHRFLNWNINQDDNATIAYSIAINLEMTLNIEIFNPEYRLFILLYYAEELPTSKLRVESGLPHSRFYSSLSNLRGKNIIIPKEYGSDMRIASYLINDEARKLADSAHIKLSIWSNDKFDR